MTLCFEIEEEADEEDRRQENSLGDIDMTLATLEVTLVRINWGQIFSLLDKKRQHMAISFKHPELFADKVNWAVLRENGVLPFSKMTKAPFLVLQLLTKACSKNKVTCQLCTQVMGLTQMHIS